MIKDALANASLYAALHPRFAAAFAWLDRAMADGIPEGRIEIDGDRLVAIPQRYETHPFDCRKFETHDKFIDIQLVVSGSEIVYMGDPRTMEPAVPYDDAKDIAFFAGRGVPEMLRAGEFLIIWPHEAHAPGCDPGPDSAAVHKIVIKVAV
ncbi:MAG: YhcH/YjgK/YiaL family protein [Kiritimatiellia bacterium]|jgi:biofilm protein TabA